MNPSTARIINAGFLALALCGLAFGALAEDPKLLVKAAKAGRLAVRLYAGDPLLFCHAAGDAQPCIKAGIGIEIVPGVPSATAVPAYAGIALTSDGQGDLRVIHLSEVSQVTAGPGSLVVLGAEAGLADLGKMLVAAGWKESTPLAITWNGTTTEQQTVLTTLGSVPADLKAAGISPLTLPGPAIAVVGEGIAAQPALSWFETKPLFGWRVLVPRTKEQAGTVSDRLREYGAVPEQVPTIVVEPPPAPKVAEAR